jgi:hypothetical protein
MLHAGLDLSRKRIDVCLLSEEGEQGATASPDDFGHIVIRPDGSRHVARAVPDPLADEQPD